MAIKATCNDLHFSPDKQDPCFTRGQFLQALGKGKPVPGLYILYKSWGGSSCFLSFPLSLCFLPPCCHILTLRRGMAGGCRSGTGDQWAVFQEDTHLDEKYQSSQLGIQKEAAQ